MLLSVPQRMQAVHVRLWVCCFFCVCVKVEEKRTIMEGFHKPVRNLILWNTQTEAPSSGRGCRKGEIWGSRSVKCIDQEAASHSSSARGPQSSPRRGARATYTVTDLRPGYFIIQTRQEQVEQNTEGKPAWFHLPLNGYWYVFLFLLTELEIENYCTFH